MNASSYFFIFFSAVIALVGLAAASVAQDYLQFFGFGLFLFGVLFAYGVVKRHYDEKGH